MLVFYSGWGYWQWFEESYDIDEKVIHIREKTWPMRACTFFELPEISVKEITHSGKTTTRYLLLSNYTEDCDIPSPDALFGDSEHNSPQFILCEEWEYNPNKQADQQDWPITISATFNKEDIQTPPTNKETPKILVEAETEQDKTSVLPVYLDPQHPMFSEELSIAIQAWNEVLGGYTDKPNSRSLKQLVRKWLDTNYPDPKLSKEAKERISTLVNPDKNGGAPRSG